MDFSFSINTPQADIKVSIIIASYNKKDYILNAIDSLYNQTISKDLYEVIVVDNNSTENIRGTIMKYLYPNRDTVKRFNFKYLEEENQGSSFARNKGAKFASGELLAFMDDDAIANKDFVERIIKFFNAFKSADALGGRIIPKYIPLKPKWMSYYVESLVGNFDYSNSFCLFEKGKYPLESNMIVRKESFNEINGFNIKLPGVKGKIRIGGEGKDFFFKLQSLNKKIYYDPQLIVQHVVEISKLNKEYMYRVASGIGRGERVRMLEKGYYSYFKKFIEYILKFGASIILGIKYSIMGEPLKARPVINFRIDAIKGLIGL